MELYIITGATRGLGAALAEALIAPDHRLVCLARGPLEELRAKAARQGCIVDALSVDFRDAPAAATALEQALAGIDLSGCTLACLINNAGVVEPVGRVESHSAAGIVAAVTVNLIAPMALSTCFLRATASAQYVRKLVNITSGAAYKVYEGWGAYCATKAGLDHYSRCVALEQKELPNGAQVVALAPGLVDTDMQATIRSQPPGVFKHQARFVALHETGQLNTPQDAARDIIAYLHSDDFSKEPVVDIRNIHR